MDWEKKKKWETAILHKKSFVLEHNSCINHVIHCRIRELKAELYKVSTDKANKEMILKKYCFAF